MEPYPKDQRGVAPEVSLFDAQNFLEHEGCENEFREVTEKEEKGEGGDSATSKAVLSHVMNNPKPYEQALIHTSTEGNHQDAVIHYGVLVVERYHTVAAKGTVMILQILSLYVLQKIRCLN